MSSYFNLTFPIEKQQIDKRIAEIIMHLSKTIWSQKRFDEYDFHNENDIYAIFESTIKSCSGFMDEIYGERIHHGFEHHILVNSLAIIYNNYQNGEWMTIGDICDSIICGMMIPMYIQGLASKSNIKYFIDSLTKVNTRKNNMNIDCLISIISFSIDKDHLGFMRTNTIKYIVHDGYLLEVIESFKLYGDDIDINVNQLFVEHVKTLEFKHSNYFIQYLEWQQEIINILTTMEMSIKNSNENNIEYIDNEKMEKEISNISKKIKKQTIDDADSLLVN